MRLGYKHDIQSDAVADRYWNNTVLPLLNIYLVLTILLGHVQTVEDMEIL